MFAAALSWIVAPAAADAGVLFPENEDWFALTENGGDAITDPDGPNPDSTDVIGDSDRPAGYIAYDERRDNLMFRMRIDRDPGTLTSVWQILIDMDDDDDVDWVLQLDESGDNEVELVEATTGGSTFDDVELATTADWSDGSGDFFQVVDTGETDFGSKEDVFIDIAVPFGELFPGTTFTTTDTFRVALTTSTTHSGINKELPGSLSDSDDVADGWGDSFAAADVAVPEPGTWALFGLGLTVLAIRTRRRRRTRPPAA